MTRQDLAPSRWRPRGATGTALLAATALLAPLLMGLTATTAAASTTRVGSVKVHRCSRAVLVFCGSIKVPLDYSRPTSPKITIAFSYRPAADGRSKGTILAVEGGPGYASTGSGSLYRHMAGPLLQTRNLLMINLRGTGNSTPVRCPGLEHVGPHQYGQHFISLVGACGRKLDHTWRYRGGGWVHAADLFNTANSARDVARVLRALRTGPVDLYGDSYGSWFSQTFASRYPDLLRSVTLDSTYQVLGLDPWYTTTVTTARRAFDEACDRWAACRTAARGPAWGLITRLDRRLAGHPVRGRSTTDSGVRGRVSVTSLTLVNLVNNAGFDPVVYQDLDAAGRALLDQHDPAPLLRLAALSTGYDDTNEPPGRYGFDDGLFFAVSCTDYVQLFRRDAAPAVRAREYAAALAREPKDTFAPFSVRQWTELDQYTEAYSACLDWPAPVRHDPPITKRPPLVPRRLPVLVLSGGLDSLTPKVHGATLVTRQVGPSARLVTVANLTHVTEEDGNNACAESIYRRFVDRPGRLQSENVSCGRSVAPVHAAGRYPLRLSGAVPAKAGPGNRAGTTALRAVTVALDTVGDEVSRYPLLSGDVDRGLRGGQVRFRAGGGTIRIRLTGTRWVTDATVSGTASWNESTQRVRAVLTVRPARGPAVRLTASWGVYARPDHPAVVTGTVLTGHGSGRRLSATASAP